MSTRAIHFLKQHRVSFEIKRYRHQEKGALFASRAIDFPLEQTVKTLVAGLAGNKHLLALAPGNRRISPRGLARAHGIKRIALADAAAAERVTGYKIGGISPFGTRRVLPVIMEATLMQYDRVAINGGQRGVMLMMSPQDIITALNGHVANIVK